MLDASLRAACTWGQSASTAEWAVAKERPVVTVRDPRASQLTLRPARPEDAADPGRICYEAFRSIAGRHNITPAFPSPDVATARLVGLLSHDGFYKVVAERDGEVVGSNFIDERSPIAGVGPITIDPGAQDRG